MTDKAARAAKAATAPTAFFHRGARVNWTRMNPGPFATYCAAVGTRGGSHPAFYLYAKREGDPVRLTGKGGCIVHYAESQSEAARACLEDLRAADPVEIAEGAPTFLRIAGAELRGAMKVALRFASKERSRFAFEAVRIQRSEDRACVVATDGKRLVSVFVGGTWAGTTDASAMIPRKVAQAWVESDEAKSEAEVEVAADRIGSLAYVGVEGQFPRPETVHAKRLDCASVKATVKANAKAFLSAMAEAKNLTNEESRSVRFTFRNGGAVLRARAMDVGEAKRFLQVRATGRGAFAVNPAFFADAIKAVAPKGGTVTIGYTGPDTPIHFRGPKADVWAVMMPVTVRA